MAGHPPGDGPPPTPRHAAPTGHAGQGDSVGPPHPHTRAHSTWVADPNSPPSGRAVGGGTAPDLRRPSQWWKAPPPGTPFRHPHSEQRRPARAHAVGPVLGPHARTDRTRDTRVAEPWLSAPEDGRTGEGQRLTPDAPHNGGRPPPPGDGPPAAPWHEAHAGHAGQRDSVGPPHPHTRAHSTWVADTNSPPNGRAVGGGTAPDLRRPSNNGGRHPPWGRPSATPTASNAPTHERTSHRTSAPHPLLLGTATQQWRNPQLHAKHAPDLQHWTQHTRSSGRGEPETAKETHHKGTRARTPTWRQYRSPPQEARTRNLPRRRAACPPSAPCGNGATAPAKAGAPNSTLSPAPKTERCPRWDPRPHAPPYATGWRRAGCWMRPHAAA